MIDEIKDQLDLYLEGNQLVDKLTVLPEYKNNLVFGGWYLDKEHTQKINFINGNELVNKIDGNGNITIYGYWYPPKTIKYNVIYHNTNNTYDSSLIHTIIEETAESFTSYNIWDLSTKNNDLSYYKYFLGWYKDQVYGGTQVTQIFKEDFNPTSDDTIYELHLYAKWENKCSVKFYDENNKLLSTSYLYKGLDFKVPFKYVKENLDPEGKKVSLTYGVDWKVDGVNKQVGDIIKVEKDMNVQFRMVNEIYYRVKGRTLEQAGFTISVTGENAHIIKSIDTAYNHLTKYSIKNPGEFVYVSDGANITINIDYFKQHYWSYSIIDNLTNNVLQSKKSGIKDKYNNKYTGIMNCPLIIDAHSSSLVGTR